MIVLTSNHKTRKFGNPDPETRTKPHPDPIRFVENVLNLVGLESLNPDPVQLWSQVHISVNQIWDFCNPNPVQYFRWEIRSYPNPVDLSKYLIQSGLYPKKTLIKHFSAVINAIWISTSDPFDFFRNPVPPGSGSELPNPVGSRSGNRIMFNTDAYYFYSRTLQFSCIL